MAWLRSLALCAPLLGGARGDVYTYPVKSINLAQAPGVEWYTGADPAATGTLGTSADFHPVHGIQTQDGGYILAGKALESETSTNKEAFAIKLDQAGAFVWSWRSGVLGDDAANAVAELADGTLLVAGFRFTGGVNSRCLTKLTAAGGETWTAIFDTTAGMHGAWEMIHLAPGGVLLAGLQDNPSNAEFAFKSYGNTAGGKASVMMLPLTAVMGTAAPSAASALWTKTWNTHMTSKAARAFLNGNVVCLLWNEQQQASVAMLSASGGDVWGPIDYHTEHGEGTDVQVTADQMDFVIAGQGPQAGFGRRLAGGSTYFGKLTRVSAADGRRAWTREYTAGGTPSLIFNECWGVVAMSDGGFTLACGTGIEQCGSDLSAQDLADCTQGLGDKRPGAYPRGAGVWQSLVVRTDIYGNLLWQRIDSFRLPEAPPLETSTAADRTSSAAEWAVPTTDGGMAVFMDEVGGIGLMKLRPYIAPPPGPAPTPAPPTPAPPTPAPPTPAPPTPAPDCMDDDAGLTQWAVQFGEESATCMEWASECEFYPEVVRLCPLACCVERCAGTVSGGRRLCASPATEIMQFQAVLPMSWQNLPADEHMAIESIIAGTTLSAAEAAALQSFGSTMYSQMQLNVAAKLNVPLSELDGLCVYVLGAPVKVSLSDTSTVCDMQGYHEHGQTTTADIIDGTDGLVLQAIITRDFMRLVLNNGTEPTTPTDKTNSQLMEELFVVLASEFSFAYAGAETTSLCLPFMYSTLRQSTGNDMETCGDVKEAYEENECCGQPEKMLGANGPTCGEVKEAYRMMACCGNPSRSFPGVWEVLARK